jgi:pyrimidine-nucleoside phosphorylase
LGITGGTLDKLESIPGFSTELDLKTIIEKVQSVGCVICGQTARIVPADKALYALRDATGTVPSIPLIVASILSKKLAEGLDMLVLDVKFGAAAFMSTLEKANELAAFMVEIANQCHVYTRALITNMDRPLGRAAGNWLEVREAVACLEGRGPEDLLELVLNCAANLLAMHEKATSLTEGRALGRACLDSGEPRRKWDEMLAAQGADLHEFNRKLASDHHAPVVCESKSERSGFVARSDARLIGEIVRDLGGGRLTKESVINHDVGVDMLVAPGEAVESGSILCRVHAQDQAQAEAAMFALKNAFVLSEIREEPAPLIAGIVKHERDTRPCGVRE